MKLRKLIREMVESELDEMARISTNIKIGDAEKAQSAKELYAGTWIEDMINFVEKEENGIPQPVLAKKLGKSGQQAINPKVRDFLEANIFTKGDLSQSKKEKAPSTGVKGRPTSAKTDMAKKVNQALEADNNYKATEEEIATLGADFIEKLRLRVKGLLKRGRKLGASTAKDGMKVSMKSIEDKEDANDDGVIDDEDFEYNYDDDEREDVMEKEEPINESFIRMQKLAGIITENKSK